MKVKNLILLATSLLATQVFADTRVNVVGLFSNKAIVTINGGAPQSLSAGQSKDGVKLVSADSSSATFMVEGKRQVLKMGQAASVAASSSPAGSEAAVNSPVNLYADVNGHFHGNLSINGVTLKYLVDTGATTVAMNSGDAKYAKIDYQKGERVPVSTANGVVNAYYLKVNSLKIGTNVFYNVDVGVLEGGSPTEVLLGMNILNQLDMKRDNSVLTMTRKY
ncbi:MAG: TIGR02281 family clan AA aspartic protease [Methylophilaceae bacterium]